MRRQRGDFIECYKILTGKENIDPHQFFHLSDNVQGHQRLKQSSSKCRRCNFGQLIQEPSRCLLEDHWMWTIKAQPTEVHNITSTSTSN